MTCLELRPSPTMEDEPSRAMLALLCFVLVLNASFGYKHTIVMHGMLGAPDKFDSFLTILRKVALCNTFPTRSIVSQYMDVYVSQSEIHKLQKAGS